MTNDENICMDKLNCKQFAENVLENMHNDAPMNTPTGEDIIKDTSTMTSTLTDKQEENVVKKSKKQITPVSNKYCNRVMKANGCLDLPVFYDNNIIVIQWKVPFLQRLKILATGNIWHMVHSRELVIQPVSLVVNMPLVKEG